VFFDLRFLAPRKPYESFKALAARERLGLDYDIILRKRPDSSTAVLAPHGGAIERGTSMIARAMAEDDLNLYCFEGLKARGNAVLHLTSHQFDEPSGLELVSACCRVVAVHGCAGPVPRICLGGLDTELREQIARELLRLGLPALLEGHEYAGEHPMNICNRGATGRGVQIEISPDLRTGSAAKSIAQGVRRVLVGDELT
jgi:phage replication-related protein YjqB (UPF0714/DUF867 family)